MASITFFLKEPQLDRPTPIIARVAHAGTKTKIYTGLSIEPRRWIQAAQQAQTRGNVGAGRLNDALASMRSRLEDCFLTFLTAGTLPTAEQLRQSIEPAAATPVAPAPSAPEPNVLAEPAGATLLAAYAQWSEEQAHRVSPRTIQSNLTSLRHLQAFEVCTGYRVNFDTLTPAFTAKFTAYLLTVAKLTDNSLAKVLSRLKVFLKAAHEQGLMPNRVSHIRWTQKEPDIITLTLAELRALEQVSLAGSPGLANARDLFLLACYTGLRYSDLVTLRPEHLQEGRLRLRTQKTKEPVMIPLRPEARVLLDKLLAGLLYPASNQKLNSHLKEVGRRAGLDAAVERVRYRGGRREAEQFRKHERLSCHTARRTFVTLALESGLRPELVMKITGHKTYSSFKRYVNIVEDTVEREFAAVYGRSDEAGQ